MPADAHVWLLEFEPDEAGWGRMPFAVYESLDDALLGVGEGGTDPFGLKWEVDRLLRDDPYRPAPEHEAVFSAVAPGKGTWTVTRYLVRPAGTGRERALPPTRDPR